MTFRETLTAVPLLLALVICPASYAATGVSWVSFSQALATAPNPPKLIVVELTAEWCPPCRLMEARVWSDSMVAERLGRSFVPVRLDVDETDSIPCQGQRLPQGVCAEAVWGVQGLPALVVLSPQGEYLFQVVGYLSKAEVLEFLGDLEAQVESLLHGPEVSP
jgi:uncharacterized protein YyaL (SSP411 family)